MSPCLYIISYFDYRTLPRSEYYGSVHNKKQPSFTHFSNKLNDTSQHSSIVIKPTGDKTKFSERRYIMF